MDDTFKSCDHTGKNYGGIETEMADIMARKLTDSSLGCCKLESNDDNWNWSNYDCNPVGTKLVTGIKEDEQR